MVKVKDENGNARPVKIEKATIGIGAAVVVAFAAMGLVWQAGVDNTKLLNRVNTLEQRAGNTWLRSDMAVWCWRFERLNDGVQCPDPQVRSTGRRPF